MMSVEEAEVSLVVSIKISWLLYTVCIQQATYCRAQFKIYTHVLRHACAHLPCVKHKNLTCTHTIACNFGMWMTVSEHM